MEVRLLGPLELVADRKQVELPRGLVRTLLAALAYSAYRPVSVDLLIEYLWGYEAAPLTARQALRNVVWRLRQVLGDGAVVADGDGYRLEVDADAVDVARFRRLLERTAVAEPAAERELLVEALALWRGEPFSGVESEALRRDAVPVLTEQYVAALEHRIDIDLSAGRHDGMVAELRRLTREHPLRETLWTRLLVALAGSGRTAEALEAYEQIRRQLADRLGADPCPELRQVHQRLLAGEPSSPAVAVSTPVPNTDHVPPPRQLPSDVPGFVGRSEQLRALDRMLGEHTTTEGSRPVLTVVIHGVGGVGKTALAVRWAHTVAEQFPDGQLHLELRGYGPGEPMTATEALAVLLRALGVQDRAVPVAADERAALLRSVLAGRRVLIVLDNARSAEQVRPLLPGADCVVLITSRGQLRGLSTRDGARSLPLREMSDREAAVLLAATIGRRRIAAQPDGAAELAALCGRLPLALRITADLASRHPDLPLRELADELRAQRLDTLADPADPAADPRAVFSWSYRALPAPDARVFRLLSVAPGSDIGVASAAALVGARTTEVRRVLDRLVAVHLLDHGRPGRYQFHDLVRVYAAEHATQEDEAAVRRLLHWYLQTMTAAVDVLRPGLHLCPTEARPAIEPVLRFHDGPDALEWYDAERGCALAAVRRAAEIGDHDTAWRFGAVGFFLNRPWWDDWRTSCEIALASAVRVSNPVAQGAVLMNLGSVHSFLDDNAEALRCYRRAMRFLAEAGATAQVGTAYALIASVHEAQGRHPEALRSFEKSVAIARDAVDEPREAQALNNMAITYLSLGQPERSHEVSVRALRIRVSIGDRRGCAHTLDNLGDAYLALSEPAKAAECYHEALEIARDHRDHRNEGIYLGNLALAQLASGEPQGARRTAHTAWTTLTGIPDTDAARTRARLRRAFPGIGDTN